MQNTWRKIKLQTVLVLTRKQGRRSWGKENWDFKFYITGENFPHVSTFVLNSVSSLGRNLGEGKLFLELQYTLPSDVNYDTSTNCDRYDKVHIYDLIIKRVKLGIIFFT